MGRCRILIFITIPVTRDGGIKAQGKEGYCLMVTAGISEKINGT